MRATDEDLAEGDEAVAVELDFGTGGEGEEGEVLAEQADVVGMLAGELAGDAEPVGDVVVGGEEATGGTEAGAAAWRRVRTDVIETGRDVDLGDAAGVSVAPLRVGSGADEQQQRGEDKRKQREANETGWNERDMGKFCVAHHGLLLPDSRPGVLSRDDLIQHRNRRRGCQRVGIQEDEPVGIDGVDDIRSRRSEEETPCGWGWARCSFGSRFGPAR